MEPSRRYYIDLFTPETWREAAARQFQVTGFSERLLWLERNRIVAAFEIKSTTAIYSGLLRMSDLLALQPGIDISLYLVAPDDRRHLVLREIRRPTFTRMETPLHNICRYLSFSELEEAIERYGDGVRYMRPDFLRSVAEEVRSDPEST